MYKEVDLYFHGEKKQKAIYDSSKELLILNYMSTSFARDCGFTWEGSKDDNRCKNGLHAIYQQGLDDAWNCLRKIVGLGSPQSIVEGAGLNNFICKYSASEAIEKLHDYEKLNEVNPGDEIMSRDRNTAVVTSMGSADNNWCCVGSNGCTFVLSRDKIKEFNWHRTGRHFPQLADMLNQLKEKENE